MLYRCLFILISLSVLTSCTEFLSSSNKKEESIQLEDSRLDCLDKATEVLNQFDRHVTDPDQVNSSLLCFQTSLEYFKSKTKASVQDPDNYTIHNLRKFFGKYFGDDLRVSEKLAIEMMRLKAALFGGSESSMSKSELQRLIALSQSIRVEIEVLKPYWRLLLISNKQDTYSIELIKKAQSQLLKSMEVLIRKTDVAKSDYSLNDFRSLIYEIEKFTKKTSQPSLELKSWLDLAEVTKKILFGENVEMSTFAKWNEATRMISEIHRFYMIYVYLFEKVDLYSKQGIRSGDELFVLNLKLLESSWVLKSAEIPFSLTEVLFKALKERKILPDNISGEGVSETYRAIVSKVLEREFNSSNGAVIGLERKHVAILKAEYEVWKSTQNFIDQFPDTFNYEELELKLKNYQIQTQNVFSVLQPRVILEAWKDWKTHLTQNIPLLYTLNGELRLIPSVKKIENWPWYSLARLNIMRTLARSLMLGYGIHRTSIVANEKLNEQSLVDWYRDYGRLGVEIKAFDPRSENSGARSFFEANIFTMAGNGDEFIDHQEVFEFINTIFSSGLSGVTKVQNHMATQNCFLPKKDVMDNYWIGGSCFKYQLKNEFSNLFNNLSGLHTFISQMDKKNWNEFYAELLNFSKNPENQEDEIETSDIRTLVVILHYIESMYIKFDQNHDDRLSKEELIQASDRFVGFFKKQFNLKSTPGTFKDRAYKYAVTQGFACMVLTGELPSIQSCAKVFLQDAWEDRYSDRLRILKTLNQLKGQVQ